MVSSGSLDGFSEEDERRALATLKEAEGDTADHNIFNAYDASRPLTRD